MEAAQLQPSASLQPAQAPTLDMTNQTESVTSSATRPKTPLDAASRSTQLEGDLNKTEDKLAAINETTGALQPPKLDLPPPPQPKQTSALEAWGSAAMVLATVGSLLTRTPLTTAMNAAAGAMKAFKENDLETANQQFAQWKAGTELAIKQQTFQMEAYKAALSKASTDSRTALAEFTARARAFGDETAAMAAQTRGIQGAEHVMIDRERLNMQMETSLPKVIESKNLMMAMKDPTYLAQIAAAKTPKEKAEITSRLMEDVAPDLAQTSGVVSDDRLRTMAEQYVAGDHSVTTGLGYGKAGSATRVRLQNMIGTVMQEQGMSGTDAAAAKAEFAGMMAAERTLGTTLSRIGLGAAEIQTLEPQVIQASEDLKRTNYPSINALIQASQKETGNTKLRSLAVRLQGLKSAFSQVLTRGGVPTDAARSSTDELFSTSDPDAVLQSALVAMNAETGAIEKAPGIVRSRLRQGLQGGNKSAAPGVGTVEDGHRFKGGDPGRPENWEKVN